MNKTAAMFVAITTVLLCMVQPVFAFPHAITTITPNPSDPNQIHAKSVQVVLGHTNEPTFGWSQLTHDGKHHVEVFLEDQATGLPLGKANLKIDKYYFKNHDLFNKAKSVNEATEIQTNVTLGSVFGDTGHYIARQIQKDGIYGYRLYGTINYFGEATIPIDTTVFCNHSSGSTKFHSPGWFGGFGCTDKITDIYFPKRG